MSNVAMGFRAPPEVHKAISDLAESEGRTMGNVLAIMIAEQVKRVQAGGFDSIFYIEESTYEQERAG